MDLIDRQAAIDIIEFECGEWTGLARTITDRIKQLPSAESERKTGKWIVHTEIKNVYGGICIECSECGERYVVHYLDAEMFCRTCGSKNGR